MKEKGLFEMNTKKVVLVAVVVIFALSTTGCYMFNDVATHEVGAQLYKNQVMNCVEPGVFTDLRWFADLREISVATMTFEVEDPEVATADNQLVGVKITIQARRKADCESIKAFLSNWARLLDDDVLVATIDATAREGIKNGTRSFDLMQLLDDRNSLAQKITAHLEEDAGKYSVEIVNVTIENVSIAAEYAKVLQDTAQLKAQEDFELRRKNLVQQKAETDKFEREQQQLVLAEQLKVEQAQTEVEIEIAKRTGEKTKAANEVYTINPQAFELERLRLLKAIFNDKTVIFIPEGTDITTFFGMEGIVPVKP